MCQTPQIRGKFDNQRATQLGVKGKDRGVLVRGGGPITLEDGRIITRSDVMADDAPGVVFAIVRCPTLMHGTILAAQVHRLISLHSIETKVVYHMTPLPIMLTDMYKGAAGNSVIFCRPRGGLGR